MTDTQFRKSLHRVELAQAYAEFDNTPSVSNWNLLVDRMFRYQRATQEVWIEEEIERANADAHHEVVPFG